MPSNVSHKVSQDSSKVIPKELTFELGHTTLKAKRWGEGNTVPVLALHGWLDNCATFDMVAPNIGDVDLVALDLAGHGLSDHRGTLASYNIWQDISEVIAVADQLNWESFGLLGHSRGAMIATLIAGTFPDRITHLATIESFVPHTQVEERTPEQLASAIDNQMRLVRRIRNYYESFEKAVDARANGFVKLSHDDARVLAQRGVLNDAQGYYWANDPLLLAPSEVMLTPGQVAAFVKNIRIPVTVFVANSGMLIEHKSVLERFVSAENVSCVYMDGEHHLHLSQQYQAISEVLTNYYVA